MYGDNLAMSDALVITLFSMGLVFVALVALSYFIDLIAKIINRKVKKVEVEVKQEEIEIVEEEMDDLELIAVISAAVAATSGKSLDSFFVRNVRVIDNEASAWQVQARLDMMR